ncbi:MAG: redoxin domain-containing protein [Rubripirellula sp.]|nr:redoxin domain-containing protein [Rubripirellula sp.]
MKRLIFFAVLGSLLFGATTDAQADPGLFSLPSTDGTPVSLSTDPTIQLEVLCFLGVECPLAKVYAPRLQRMADEFAARGVRFIGINSNIQDSMEEVARYAEEHQLTFPLAKDYDRRVALQMGATRTPEVFVVDRAGEIRYQGRIDDQFQVGVSRKQAMKHDLRNAIEQLLAGQPVAVPRTSAPGCLIALPRQPSQASQPSQGNAPEITFCDQVIRVLRKHCVDCHRDGEIGPFTLDDYEEVQGWADMSLEVIDSGRMPPWHANPEHGAFRNSRGMNEADKQTFRRWVESGMPYGQATDLPPSPKYVPDWRLTRTPDVVFPISDQPFELPADGTIEYQYFVIDPQFKEERWVRAAQVIPGNPAVVHHCIAFARPPDGGDFRDISLLSAYVPGQIRGELPSGYAQRIAPGAKIVLQMHYTPTGKPEQDLTRLGLVFADADDVTHEVYSLACINQDFEIPPGVENYEVNGNQGWFPKNGSLLAITPHMHLRGKSFRVDRRSGAVSETLLDVPAYDFNWQHNYELIDPLPLDSTDQISFTAVFDNSTSNPNNPDAKEYVTWGDQTWQEMALTFLTVAQPIDEVKRSRLGQAGKKKADERSLRMMTEDAESEQKKLKRQQQWQQQAERFAEKYLKRFDGNEDGFITAHELPDSVRIFSFWTMDQNHDDRISMDELSSAAFQRARNNKELPQ